MKTLQELILLSKEDIEYNLASELNCQEITQTQFSKNYNQKKKSILKQFHKKSTISRVSHAFIFLFFIIIAYLSIHYRRDYNLKLK